MNCQFEYADKNKLETVLPKLFELLSSNMSIIAPTGNSYDEDYRIWLSNIEPAMQKPQRQIILILCDNDIVGYFQYYINSRTFMMEEIQIEKSYRGTGIFSAFYSWLVYQLPNDIECVEAYAHKKNFKSQGILEHLGLKQLGESKNGNSYHYIGEYINLKNKYK